MLRTALAVDGGGVRGLIPARLLAELEARCERPTADLFDLMVGNSVGGLLALVLAMPGRGGEPAFTAQQAGALVEEAARRVFAPRWWHRLPVAGFVGNAFGLRHRAEPLEALLRETFGDCCLGDARTDVMVGACDVEHGEPRFFRSWGDEADLPMREAARATSSVPGFFDLAVLRTGPQGTREVLVDGALFANNPGLVACVELRDRLLPGDEPLLVSLSAGRLRCRVPYPRAARWGLLEWGPRYMHLAVDGSSRLTDLALGRLLPPRERGRASCGSRGTWRRRSGPSTM